MQEYNFTLNQNDLAVIEKSLVNQPYGMVVGVINKLNQQLLEQQQPKEEAKPE